MKGLGRRKTAVARVRLVEKPEARTVNGVDFDKYFLTASEQMIAASPLVLTSTNDEFGFEVRVSGGGKAGQAYAVRLGIARALLAHDEAHRKHLRAAGMLTRDARKKERKKPGLKGARRAPQFSKR